MAVLASYTLIDFNQPEPSPEEKPVRRFAEEEVERLLAAGRDEAREAGHAEGYERGHEAAMQSVAADEARALARLASSLEQMGQDKVVLGRELEAQIESFLVQLVRTLAPQLGTAFRPAYLDDLVCRAARAASDSRKLRLLLPADLGEEVHGRLIGLARSESHDLVVEIAEEPGLAPGAAEARWDKGVMRLDIEAFAAALIAAVGEEPDASANSSMENEDKH